jgi:glycosyltransferase involved in cell wall biosynthesis
MKFLIITHVIHKKQSNLLYAYEPYVREMNLWFKNTTETMVVAPLSSDDIGPIDAAYNLKILHFNEVPSFNFVNFNNAFKSFVTLPVICYRIYKSMKWADHIHLRCPGNMGLLGAVIQIFFPKKPKTVKYAGNWDPTSEQPKSYRFQKWLISNPFLTRNCKVLVYGDWPNQSKNIKPFFTASYKKDEIKNIIKKDFKKLIDFIYVGAFTKSKQPLLSVTIVEQLIDKGYNCRLRMYGTGIEYDLVKQYIYKKKLKNKIILFGDTSKEIVKKSYQESHFLLFLSKSEGWPKVVSEAMFWGCVPVTKKISCVPWMLENGRRGLLVEEGEKEISKKIIDLIEHKKVFDQMSLNAKKWSREYTLESFEYEIHKLLNETD